jgi:hypothetical protein
VRTSRLLGVVAMGLLIVGFVTLLPDIRRYIRISTM